MLISSQQSNGSGSSFEETKQQAPQKGKYQHWLGTWNDFPDDWMDRLKNCGARFVSAQLEEASTKHVQFYLYFHSGRTATHIQERLPGSWHRGKSSVAGKDVYLYCTPTKGGNLEKAKTVVQGTHFEYGKRPKFQVTDRYKEALDTIKQGKWEEVDAEFQIKHYGNITKLSAHYQTPQDSQDCRGIWIWGESGTGKSFAARTQFPGPVFIKAQNKWWDGYRGECTVVLDDFDRLGTCLSHHLKIWTDRYGARGEIKSGSVALAFNIFIITSNYRIEELFDEEADPHLVASLRRRFRVGRPRGSYPNIRIEWDDQSVFIPS